jgi:hypothetical protein
VPYPSSLVSFAGRPPGAVNRSFTIIAQGL